MDRTDVEAILKELKAIHKHLEKPGHWLETAIDGESRLYKWCGPPKPTILDEEWEAEKHKNGVYRTDTVSQIALCYEYKKEIAALPDLCRALVMVREKYTGRHGEAWGSDTVKAIDHALKKAGIQ